MYKATTCYFLQPAHLCHDPTSAQPSSLPYQFTWLPKMTLIFTPHLELADLPELHLIFHVYSWTIFPLQLPHHYFIERTASPANTHPLVASNPEFITCISLMPHHAILLIFVRGYFTNPLQCYFCQIQSSSNLLSFLHYCVQCHKKEFKNRISVMFLLHVNTR